MGKRTLVRLAAVAAGGLLGLAVAAPAFSDHTDVATVPKAAVTITSDDVSNSDGPTDCLGTKIKLDDMGEAPGEWDVSSGDVSIEVAGDAAKHYSVKITGDVLNAIHIAGGSFDKSYYFEPPVTEAHNLTAPVNTGGQLSDASHIWFCFDKTPPSEEPTPPASEEPTPPASEEPTPPASEEPTPPASEEPTTPGGTTPPGKSDKPGLPVTGMSVGGLLILSGGLLSAGIALVAVRRRRSLSDLLDS